MEEWKALADTVLDTLQPVANTDTAYTLLILTSARGKLARWIRLAIWFRRGFVIHNIPDPPPAGICPTVILADAHQALGRLCAVHAQAGSVFRLCRPRLGGAVQSDPLWPVWEGRRAAALRHAARAREALRSAAAHAEAVVEAGAVMELFPPGSPGRIAWSSATLNLARRAMWGATTAMVELRLMSKDVGLECLYVYKILHRPPLHVRCLIEALRAYAAAASR